MSSSIHYKFRTQNVYKTLSFDGPAISPIELKRSICATEGIKAELFDLTFSNSFNQKVYDGEDMIPRNSSVTVQRVPVENGSKLPKISNPEIGVAPTIQATPDTAAHIKSEDFQKMSEVERLKHAMHQSTYKYAPTNYNRKPTANNSQTAPPDYQCNRCNQYGHFPKACPLINIRRTTGIPNEELVETTADDPNAMLHPSGRFVIHKMHVQAREQQKLRDEQKRMGVVPQNQRNEKQEVPKELKCPMCQDIYKEALATRCGESFCADCIQQKLIEASLADEPYYCPICKSVIGTNDVFANNTLRESVEKHKRQVLTNATYANILQDSQHGTTPDIAIKTPSPSHEKADVKNQSAAPTPPVENEQTLPNIDKQEAEPMRLPTVNLSAILAPSTKPNNSPESLILNGKPAASAFPVPTPIVPPIIVDFTKPPPVISIMDFSVPPPSVNVQSAAPQNPPPTMSTSRKKSKSKSPEMEFDERDAEAMKNAWDSIGTFDESLDLAELLLGRRFSPPPEIKRETTRKSRSRSSERRHSSKAVDERSSKDLRRSRTPERRRSRTPERRRSRTPERRRSRTPERRRSRTPELRRSRTPERRRSRTPERRRSRTPERSSRSKDTRVKSRSKDRKSRSKERSSRPNRRDRIRSRTRSRSPLHRSSDFSKRKELSHRRDESSSRRHKNDSDRHRDSRHSEKKTFVKEERSERRIELPVLKKDSQNKKNKTLEKDAPNKEASNTSISISGASEKVPVKVEKVSKKEEEVLPLKISSRRRSLSRSTSDHKKASAKEEKKKSKSEEKKKKKHRHSSGSQDEDEDKKKKKRKKKDKKHKKDRKREKYDSDSDAERVRRKRKK